MAKRTARDQAELRAATEHVAHERELLGNTLRMLDDRNALAGVVNADIIRRALLVSFLAHARSLVGFLGWQLGAKAKPAHLDDIVASDFLPLWVGRAPSDSGLREQCSTAIHRGALHLSYERVSWSQAWRLNEIHDAIVEDFDRWLSEMRLAGLDSLLADPRLRTRAIQLRAPTPYANRANVADSQNVVTTRAARKKP